MQPDSASSRPCARRKGAWVIGANADQNGVAPAVTLGSVVIDMPHAFLLLAREVKDRSFTPRVILFDSATDVVRWTPNPALRVIPPAVAARIDEVRAQMVAHEFHMPASVTP